jgi:acyl CoA:acetate/3-ketoacid CoA transferase beta subunit
MDARADLYVASLARELRDHETVFVGANQPDVALAAYLARRLWAPRLRIWAAGTAQLDPAMDLAMVGRRTNDRIVLSARGASFHQARAFEDVRAPVVFAGGLQVDSRGNANLAGVRDGAGGWHLRGPGSAGLPSLTVLSRRFFIAVARHDPRALVERCSAISVLGDPLARRALGLPGGALRAVITPLATFRPTDAGLQLCERAPGVTDGDLAAATGFELRPAGRVVERRGRTLEEAAELRILREGARRNRIAGHG